MIIGLTGQIGSGKSYISSKFKERGFEVIDLDKITLLAYEDKSVKEDLDKEFKCIEDNKVNKKILKEKLNEKTIPILNKIVLPFIIDYIKKIDHKDKNILVEVPLLFEYHLESLFYKTIAIDIDENTRNELLKKRNPENYEFMKMLEKFQLTTKEKASKANYVIIHKLQEDKLISDIDKIIVDLLSK